MNAMGLLSNKTKKKTTFYKDTKRNKKNGSYHPFLKYYLEAQNKEKNDINKEMKEEGSEEIRSKKNNFFLRMKIFIFCF